MKFAEISEIKAKKISIILFIILLLLVFVLILSVVLSPKRYDAVTYSFSTFVTQTVYGEQREQAAKEAADAAAGIEDLLSFDSEGSETAKINENAGDKWTAISSLSFDILYKAKELCELTGGDFDISIAPVSRLYRFDGDEFTPPDDALVEKYAEFVDYKELRLDSEENSASFAHFGYALDIDNILMAAACDAAAEVYKKYNIESAAVVIGNCMGIMGEKPDGRKWEAEVNTPEGDGELGVIELSEGFVATVSKYDNYSEVNGIEYHGIIDPKTGYPADNNLESVTVVSKSGIESAALSYAAFVKGYSDSLDMLNKADAFAIFVFEDNTVRVFGEDGVFSLTNKNYKMR